MFQQQFARKRKKYSREELCTQDGVILLHKLKDCLCKDGLIDQTLLLGLLKGLKHLIGNEPNLIQVNGKEVIIVGDIHGQIYDLLKIAQLFQVISSNGLVLFMGDYVDRGINSMEVLILVMAIKVTYPDNVVILRGNHQSRTMTGFYSFKRQCVVKYSQDIYDEIMTIFDCLPLACIIDKKYFCVHGGISDKLTSVAKLNNLDRFKEIPSSGPFCDLIWSDPSGNEKGDQILKAMHNTNRDCSIVFGRELVDEFLSSNDLECVIRAHQVFPEGYKVCRWLKPDRPSVITVFSAPNYGGSRNKSAIIRVNANNIVIHQFEQQDPNMFKISNEFNVFLWSTPTLIERAAVIMNKIFTRFLENRMPILQGMQTSEQVEKFFKMISNTQGSEK